MDRSSQAQYIGETVLRHTEAARQVWSEIPPQSRIIALFATSALVGLVIYTIPFGDPWLQFWVMAVFTLAFAFLGKDIPGPPETRMGLIAGAIAGGSIWMYVFYRAGKLQELNASFGLREFICKSKFGDICKLDGTSGPYNGTTLYVFNSGASENTGIAGGTPTRVPATHYIPQEMFQMDDPDNFTYSFWMRVSYADWSNPSVLGKNKPILLRTNGYVKEATPGIWLDPSNDTVKFEVATTAMARGGGPATAYTHVQFPMDLWVHYTMIIRGGSDTVVEVYKNGLLEQTIFFHDRPLVKRARLYICATPDMIGGTTPAGYARPPVQMLFLSYFNKALTPEEVNDIYKAQLPKIQKLPPPPKSLTNAGGGNLPPSCPASCLSSDDKKPLANSTADMMDLVDAPDAMPKLNLGVKDVRADFNKWGLTSIFNSGPTTASPDTEQANSNDNVQGVDDSVSSWLHGL